ncbi:SCO7613 C-terminal domain-containing membrane protein [Streptosporangium sp. NPDC004379]|uniref:SCO7613 C-terminal domain-containing membrane protein n=1 Tax=Streptosporangium sp. NPDC004379 TaxID=3366189 RepID=UPI0036B70A8C
MPDRTPPPGARLPLGMGCPECDAPIDATYDRCPRCALPLRGPVATRLWHVDRALADLRGKEAELLERRGRLLARLRAERAPSAGPGTAGARRATGDSGDGGDPRGDEARRDGDGPWDGGGVPDAGEGAGNARGPRWAAGAGSGPLPAGAPGGPAVPRRDLSPRAVQNLLLTLGGLLLVVAAVVFTAVNWGRIGIGGRAAILAGVTVLALATPRLLVRRSLATTAETVAMLGAALLLLDGYAARRVGLAGAGDLDGRHYAALVSAVVAFAMAGYSRLLPLRLPLPVAIVLAQLPLPLLFARGVDVHSTAALAATVALDAALIGLLTRRARGSERDAGGRWAWVTASVCFGLAWISAVLCGVLHAAFAAPATGAVPGAVAAGLVDGALLVALAVIGVAVAVRPGAPARTALAAASALAASAGLAAPLWTLLPGEWQAVSQVAAALVVAAVALYTPGPVAARIRGAAGAPGPVAAWIHGTASGPGPVSARIRGATDAPVRGGVRIRSAAAVSAGLLAGLVAVPALAAGIHGLYHPLARPWAPPVEHVRQHPPLVVLAVLTVIALAVLGGRAAGRAGAIAAASAAGPVVPAALAASAVPPYGAEVALLVAGVVPAAWAVARGRAGGTASTTGAARAAGTADAADAAGTTGAAEAAGVAGALWAGSTAVSWALATRPATLIVLPVLAVIGAAVAAGGRTPAVRAGAAGAAALLLGGEALAAGLAAEWPVRYAAFGVQAVACVAAVVAGRLRRSAFAIGAETAGYVLAAAGLLLAVAGSVPGVAADAGAGGSGADLPVMALACAVAGVLMAGTALRPDRRQAGYAGTGLLLAASWLRLLAWDVSVIEAYTVPFALVLVIFGRWRARGARTSSWSAYGAGLATGLLPSAFAVLQGGGWVRPLLLGLVSMAVLLAGARWRLQAPALLGGLTLAVVVLHELAPWIALAVVAVPRWVPMAAGGSLLVALGATYEARLRDVRRLRAAVGRMR